MTRRRIALLALTLSFAVIGVWRGPAVWQIATTKLLYQFHLGHVSEHRVHRWRQNDVDDMKNHRSRIWNKAGYLIDDAHFFVERFTKFDHGGAVIAQAYYDGTGLAEIDDPPWLWGVKDQAEPTAPWVLAGKSQEEWWRSLPSSKKGSPF